MKKRKYNRTRKHKAVARTLVAAALFAAAVGMNIIGPLPICGLRILEESYGTGRTKVVTKTFEKAVFSEIFLTENEHVLMLAASRFSALAGWVDLGAAVVDKDPDAGSAIEAGVWSISDFDSDECIFYIFGKVTDASVTAVNAGIADADRTVLQSAGAEAFIEKNGSRYFIIKMIGYSQIPVYSVIIGGYDQNNLLIFESEVEHQNGVGTSFSWLNNFESS